MNHFECPPLDRLTFEEISQAAHEIDKRYWPLIIAFRVANFIPPSVPVPPQRPLQLIELFRSYALELFKAEADRFEPFRADRLYVPWLSDLSNRIGVHIQDVFRQLEEGDPDSLLTYHGASNLRIGAAVQEAMSDLIKQHMQEPRIQPETSSVVAASVQDSSGTRIGNRERIEKFILKMAASGLKIKRKDIWQVAGYEDRTEFERFQRGEERNRAASMNFNRILNLESADFRKLLAKLKQ